MVSPSGELRILWDLLSTMELGHKKISVVFCFKGRKT